MPRSGPGGRPRPKNLLKTDARASGKPIKAAGNHPAVEGVTSQSDCFRSSPNPEIQTISRGPDQRVLAYGVFVMNLIQTLEKEQAAKLSANKTIPDFEPGDTLIV